MNKAFRALADPTRRKILTLLKKGEMNAGEIAAHFDIRPASVSHHLKELTNAGLIMRERRGQRILYSLNATVFEEVIAWFLEINGRHQ
ncbi:autorepressor SdpR family transcription factor [Marispirochaeta sp.]|jgi:ArsR family transcriptional regulator, arsenate/arsenite/antimonite-responsive transcriptional repressor|uniref:autorepressor SdpR family transcription factor n=1 Tax=Marispirochaeta sp. TaxID=2038653 RepID=UPI0029C7BBF7|nr:autorepressor SdpR family transcription factor [Marispirochaeta sp.]